MGFKKKGEQYYEDFYMFVRKKSAMLRRVKEFKKKTKGNLSSKQKNEVKNFFSKYKQPNTIFHKWLTDKTGEFCVNYLPIDLYVGYVDPYFNDIKAAKYFENKCNYAAIFNKTLQPDTIVKRVNGIWLDGCDRLVKNKVQLKNIIENNLDGGCFLKEAQITSGGFGVFFISDKESAFNEIIDISNSIKTDLLLQKKIIQHDLMTMLNPSSVNTLRIFSVLGKNAECKIYSSVVRIGVGDTKVDNYASGGLAVGVTSEGRMRKYAYNKKGDRFYSHPETGIVFEDYRVPFFEKVIRLVKESHAMIPHFRAVSWDVALTKEGNPILIEANLCRGGIDLLQLCNGPLFGDDTKNILDIIFDK